jgi:hypothetical protein
MLIRATLAAVVLTILTAAIVRATTPELPKLMPPPSPERCSMAALRAEGMVP